MGVFLGKNAKNNFKKVPRIYCIMFPVMACFVELCLVQGVGLKVFEVFLLKLYKFQSLAAFL
jgi:hypothetical protein